MKKELREMTSLEDIYEEAVSKVQEDEMYKYIVSNYKNDDDCYYVGFDNKDEAMEYVCTEQGDFRWRTLYDCTDGLPEDFIIDWCLEIEGPLDDDELEAKEAEFEENGFVWDDGIEAYTMLGDDTEGYRKELFSEKELFEAALSNWHCDLDGTTDLGTAEDWEIDYKSIDYDDELIYALALCKTDGRTYTLYMEGGDIVVSTR